VGVRATDRMIDRNAIGGRRRYSRGSSRCKRYFVAMPALAVVQLLVSMAFAQAQGSPPATSDIPEVPERLRYLFDLPWCKRWNLICIDCERKDNRIVCEKKSDTCGGFQQYYCKEYNVPEECLSWNDGCNVCDRIQCPPVSANCGSISCTARGCFNPKPRFACLSPRTWPPSSRDLLWPWNDGIR
jgi:hypothetical protein